MNQEKQSNNRKHKGEGLEKLVIPQSHRDPKISSDMKCQVLTRGKTLGQRKETVKQDQVPTLEINAK